MWIVDKLWNGQVLPSEEPRGQFPGYRECMREASESEDRLLALLSPEGKAVYDDYFQKHTAMGAMLEQQAFIQGFQIAGRLLLDMVTNQ